MSEQLLGIPPVYRIETPRLVIRCYNPSDAELLRRAISASVDHLRPWMPWAAAEPEEFQAKVERLRKMRARFDLGEEYVFGIFLADESELIGGSGFHRRIGPNALEIGYWIHAGYINQGYATEMAAALTKVAFEVERVKRVEIHCATDNVRSAAIPRKLGYLHEATLKRRTEDYRGNLIDSMIWTLFDMDYLQSPAKLAEIRAYDAIGRQLL